MDRSTSEPDYNPYGRLRVPGLNISLEQLILILYPTLLIPAIYFWFTHLQKNRRAALTPAGCRQLCLRGTSHMIDEFDSRYDEGTDDQNNWKIKALFMHPIKSCAPVEVDELDVDAAGATWDRKFCFAELLPPSREKDASNEELKPKWTFRTLRQPGLERLVLIKPEVWVPDETLKQNKPSTSGIERNGALIIKYPNIPSGALAPLDRLMIRLGLLSSESFFQVPLLLPKNHKYPREEVKIWRDNPAWFNYGEHLPDDFRHFLGTKNPVTLFRADPDRYREVYRCAPRESELGYQSVVGFADAYPLNLLNLASVHDVGNRIQHEIEKFSAKRFRGNVLLSGPKPYDEDDWKRIMVHTSASLDQHRVGGGFEFFCACHCVRCRLPNVDPDTAVRHASEPDKTLKGFRCIDEGDPNNACMGLQLVPAVSRGIRLRVGDRIEVLTRGQHVYIKQGH